MKIKNFEDIKKIDEELACLFLDSNDAVKWVNTINSGGVKEWIKKNNKQYWDVVRFVSLQRGVLGKLQKDRKTMNLHREDFARILMKYCPEALDKSDTVKSLKSNMEQYKYAKKFRNLSIVLETHEVRLHIKAVENIFDEVPVIEEQNEHVKPSLEDILNNYLHSIVEEKKDGFPCSKIVIRPQYNNTNPAIAIETYKSKAMLDDKLPSHIEAYEIIDGVLEKGKLSEFIVDYENIPNIKLFVVSAHGLKPEICKIAREKNVGYVRLNPDKDMTSDCYVLPRSINDYERQLHDMKVIEGLQPMSVPLLVFDRDKITASLSDSLNEYNVAIKPHQKLRINYLKKEEIEKRVNAITAPFVDEKISEIRMLWDLAQKATFRPYDLFANADFSIDPFSYADQVGLKHDVRAFEDESQLGLLDITKKQVFLNSSCMNNYERHRFTMAHELGHYILHFPIFEKMSVVSVGDTDSTLDEGSKNRVEFQANLFASYLLMPEKLIIYLYSVLYQMYEINEYGGSIRYIYYSPNQKETWPLYNNVVGTMSRILDVSIQALEIRLQELNLLKKDE